MRQFRQVVTESDTKVLQTAALLPQMELLAFLQFTQELAETAAYFKEVMLLFPHCEFVTTKQLLQIAPFKIKS